MMVGKDPDAWQHRVVSQVSTHTAAEAVGERDGLVASSELEFYYLFQQKEARKTEGEFLVWGGRASQRR